MSGDFRFKSHEKQKGTLSDIEDPDRHLGCDSTQVTLTDCRNDEHMPIEINLLAHATSTDPEQPSHLFCLLKEAIKSVHYVSDELNLSKLCGYECIFGQTGLGKE